MGIIVWKEMLYSEDHLHSLSELQNVCLVCSVYMVEAIGSWHGSLAAELAANGLLGQRESLFDSNYLAKRHSLFERI